MTSYLKVDNAPESNFLRVANDFIRSDVSPPVKAVVLYLASHSDGFVIHDQTAARDLGMARNTYTAALDRAWALDNVTRTQTGDRDKYGHPIYALTVNLRVCDRPCSKFEHGHVQKLSTKKTTVLEDQLRKDSIVTCDQRSESPGGQADPKIEDTPSLASEGDQKTSQGRPGVGRQPAIHLPKDWQPNQTHLRSYEARRSELAPYSLDDLVEMFQVQQRDKKLRNWNKSFGAYINSVADDRFEIDFPSFPSEDDDE